MKLNPKKILLVLISLLILACNESTMSETNSVSKSNETSQKDAQTTSKSSETTLKKKVLFKNVKVFDGRSKTLSKSTDVLIHDNKIEKIMANITPQDDDIVIDGKGNTLMPGFIDSHAHLMFQIPITDAAGADRYYHGYVATQSAETYLMNGFTSVRDVAGNSFSLKKAIDKDLLVGPRIYPSGPMISQTSGHADHRSANSKPILLGGDWSIFNKYGHTLVVDGVPEVLRGVRETLRRGASQIKIAVGGGTGSEYDPLDVVQFTDDEIKAAVEAAKDWNTYVLAHVYNSDGIKRAIEQGVKCIEHANLVDEKTMKLMKKHDVWLSPQVIVYTYHPNGYTEDQKRKHDQAFAGIDAMFKVAKKIGFDNIVFGTDIITSPEVLARMNDEFIERKRWFSSAEILKQATSKSAELLALSGNRNPYPGKLGVVEEDALADLLLIKGNPIEKLEILTNPNDNLLVIMKDGKIYKNKVTGYLNEALAKRVNNYK